jgi:hypothetical protein
MAKMSFRSKNEKEAYETLRLMFPNTTILHDFHLGEGLKLDFLIKSTCKIGVEIDGDQHFKFNTRWHKTKMDFENQKRRDERKAVLCSEKGIVLVRYDARNGVSPSGLHRMVKDVLDTHQPTTKKKVDPWKERQKEIRKEQYRCKKEREKEERNRKRNQRRQHD